MTNSTRVCARWSAALLLAAGAAGVPAQQPTTQEPTPRPPAQQEPLQPMLLPQAVVLPRGEQEVLVDGSLVDWPKLPAIRLDDRRQLSGTALGAWRGPRDCSAMAAVIVFIGALSQFQASAPIRLVRQSLM